MYLTYHQEQFILLLWEGAALAAQQVEALVELTVVPVFLQQ
jgi:peptide deformylase